MAPEDRDCACCDDEERLISASDPSSQPRRISLPKVQVLVLLIAYFTQPVACTVIYPFIAKLVAELDLVNGDPSKIGYYSGLFDALPLLSEAVAILHWTRLGEAYGRKSVLLLGAIGVAFSLVCFGLSKTLPTLIISRALQGALNANSGTIKTMLGEITEGDEVAMARAFSFIPIVWASGSTLAPLVGGVLQHPYERFPSVFTADLWKKYPYLLPSIAAASVPIVAFFAVLLLLKQKPVTPISARRTPSYGTMNSKQKTVSIPSTRSPSLGSDSSSSTSDLSSDEASDKPQGFHWTRTLIVTLLNYSVLVFLCSSFYALISLFLAAPIVSGGLGFEPATIGVSIALMGLCHGTFQAFFFVRIHQRVDPKKLFRMSLLAFGPLYGIMPVMNWVARERGVDWVVSALIFLQSVLFMASFMGYSCMYIFVTQAAPNRESLAKTNGLSQIVFSIFGALGPTLITILFAITQEYNLLHGYLVYVIMLSLSLLGVVISSLLPSREEMKNNAPLSH